MAAPRGIVISVVLAALATGCASKPKIVPARPAEELYASAERQMEKKLWDRAAEDLQALVDTHPYHHLTTYAELRLADMYFLDRRYPEAIAAYEQFIKLHPTSEWVPYAMYLVASAHFHQRVSYDRDPTATQKAADAFERLIKNHAGSRYAAMARERLAQARSELAEHEFYVGAFYFKQKRYEAALRRFQKVTRLYPEQPASSRAQLRAGECQLKLSQPEEARRTLSRLMHQESEGELASRAAALLEEAGLAPLPAGALGPTAPERRGGHAAAR